MNKNKIIKPWNINFMAFFVFFVFILNTLTSRAQNVLEKNIQATGIESISINGNQIFSISVSTSTTDIIKVISILDGEYQNDYQVVLKEDQETLYLGLEHFSLFDIPDDKRNAHKVIAATLYIEIPEQLNLNISSDIGSVSLKGNYKALYIELLRGQCNIEGEVVKATVNTLDGNINVITNSATMEANSNHGEITLDEFSNKNSIWELTSINGDITVVKR